MNIEWEAVDKCPVCGGEGVPSIDNLDPEINEHIYVYFCPFCKCAYHNPRMSQKSMAEYYSSGLYRSDPSRDLTNKYGRAMLAAESKVLMVDTFCRDIGAKVDRCLDYGCSRGYLVKQLEKHFKAEALGYDIYKDPEAYIDVIDSKDKITGKFDLITCIHVLEHLPNPTEELEWMVSMLNEDGVIFLEIPFMRMVFPPHPIMFSRESVFYQMRRLQARYIFYDMQYATDSGLLIFQPYHPTVWSPVDYHPTMIGYIRKDEST